MVVPALWRRRGGGGAESIAVFSNRAPDDFLQALDQVKIDRQRAMELHLPELPEKISPDPPYGDLIFNQGRQVDRTFSPATFSLLLHQLDDGGKMA
jgi:hypothetical protein